MGDHMFANPPAFRGWLLQNWLCFGGGALSLSPMTRSGLTSHDLTLLLKFVLLLLKLSLSTAITIPTHLYVFLLLSHYSRI